MITGNSTMSPTDIFQGQTYEEIELETGIDLTNATDVFIGYKKEDGTHGVWNAEKSGTRVVKQITQSTDLAPFGDWELQAAAVIAGEVAYGKIVKIRIQQPLLFITPPPPSYEQQGGEDGSVLTDENGNILIPE